MIFIRSLHKAATTWSIFSENDTTDH